MKIDGGIIRPWRIYTPQCFWDRYCRDCSTNGKEIQDDSNNM